MGQVFGHGRWLVLAASLIGCGGGGGGKVPGGGGGGGGGNVAPAISVQPADAAISECGTATFSVTATGTAPLTYQWRRNGVSILGASSSTFTTLAAPAAESGARFSVVVTNGTGSATSREALLTVTAPAPGAGHYVVGQAGSLTTSSTSIPFADQAVAYGSANLVAARADAPAQKVVLEQAGQWYWPGIKSIGAVLEGTSGAGGALGGLRQRYTLYAKGNRLFKVDHQAGAGGPSPAAWSTILTTQICFSSYLFFPVAHDFADPSRSYAFFTSPRPGGTCFDYGADFRPAVDYRAIRLGMGGSDAPLTVPAPLAPILSAGGALTGFIVREGDRVKRVDADFANPVDLFAAPVGLVTVGVFGSAPPGVWVYSVGTDLVAVDLSNPVSPVSLGLGAGAVDPETLAVDGGSMFIAFGSSVIRIDENLTATALGSSSGGVSQLGLTPSRVIVESGGVLRSIPRSGGSAVNIGSGAQDLYQGVRRIGALDPSSGSTMLWQRYFLTGGENVYYGSSGLPYSVHVVASDGSGATDIPAARIASWAEAASVPWMGNRPAHTVFIAENQGTGLFAGSPVKAYDPATRALRFSLGSFPAYLSLQTLADAIDPVQVGGAGVLSTLTATLGATTLPYNLFLFSTDGSGLTQATCY